jgi:hypothetical protein
LGKRDVNREIVGEKFGKREIWKRNSVKFFWKKIKQMRETIKKKMKWLLRKMPLHITFFLLI